MWLVHNSKLAIWVNTVWSLIDTGGGYSLRTSE
jgi:hypothetical protein